MMFETKDEIRIARNACREFVLGLHRGQMFLYEDFYRLTGLDRTVSPGRGIVRGLVKWCLRERGIYLIADDNVGYRLLTEEEQLTEAPRIERRRQIRSNRKLRMSLSGIDPSKLSDKSRLLRLVAIDRCSAERKTLVSSHRAHLAALRSETRPIPPRSMRSAISRLHNSDRGGA